MWALAGSSAASDVEDRRRGSALVRRIGPPARALRLAQRSSERGVERAAEVPAKPNSIFTTRSSRVDCRDRRRRLRGCPPARRAAPGAVTAPRRSLGRSPRRQRTGRPNGGGRPRRTIRAAWSHAKGDQMASQTTPNRVPPPAVADVLRPAYAPCPAFGGACRCVMRWDPAGGHVPRGFRGAAGTVEEVRLVLVCAEPGDPFPGEAYPFDGDAEEYLRRVLASNRRQLSSPRDQYLRNLGRILDMAWPGAGLDEQLRRTWVTNSVLCSAPKETGPVPRRVELECINRYLKAQLALFPRARVVALGRKAETGWRVPGSKSWLRARSPRRGPTGARPRSPGSARSPASPDPGRSTTPRTSKAASRSRAGVALRTERRVSVNLHPVSSLGLAGLSTCQPPRSTGWFYLTGRTTWSGTTARPPRPAAEPPERSRPGRKRPRGGR